MEEDRKGRWMEEDKRGRLMEEDKKGRQKTRGVIEEDGRRVDPVRKRQ